jgi:hypothetical protein
MNIGNKRLLPTDLCALALALAGMPAHAESTDLDWLAIAYVWGSAISVDASDRSVDASFSDVVDKLDMAFMGHVEAQADNFGGFVDVAYMSVSDSQTVGPVSVRGELDLTLMDVALVWSPSAERFAGADVYGGFRYISTDFGLRAEVAPPPEPPLTAGVDTSYTDFLLGARYVAPLNDQWRLVFSGDLSTGDTEGTWSLAGYGVYRNGPHRFYGGYRHLDTEMEGSNGVRVQTTFSGPVVGYGFAF